MYVVTSLIFLALFILRIFFTCFWSFYRKNGGCVTKTNEDTLSEEMNNRMARDSSDIFVVHSSVDCNNTNSFSEIELPSYECLMDEAPPPNYEEALNLSSDATVSKADFPPV